MALTHDEVVHLSHLAKLPLEEKSIDSLSTQLSSVVDYFNELQSVDTENITETSQTTGLLDVFRKDTVNDLSVLTQDSAISQAHEAHNGFFVVPQILDKE